MGLCKIRFIKNKLLGNSGNVLNIQKLMQHMFAQKIPYVSSSDYNLLDMFLDWSQSLMSKIPLSKCSILSDSNSRTFSP